MRTLKTLALAAGLCTSFAANAQQNYVMTCSEIVTKLNREATEEAKARFADLRGSCLGVVDRGGNLYMHTTMVVRKVRNDDRLTLYVPATDRTFRITPDPSARFEVDGRSIRPRNLLRGQEVDLFVSVDKFTQPVIDEIALPTGRATVLVIATAELVPTLPTTG